MHYTFVVTVFLYDRNLVPPLTHCQSCGLQAAGPYRYLMEQFVTFNGLQRFQQIRAALSSETSVRHSYNLKPLLARRFLPTPIHTFLAVKRHGKKFLPGKSIAN